MNKKIEDLEKLMKRSNDKQLKIDHELFERVGAPITSSILPHSHVSVGDLKYN